MAEWETPEQWEARTGEKLPEDAPIWWLNHQEWEIVLRAWCGEEYECGGLLVVAEKGKGAPPEGDRG